MASVTTTSRTLWSETLLEMLNYALRQHRADREVRQIVSELRSKGYRSGYLLAKVQRDLGDAKAGRLRLFL